MIAHHATKAPRSGGRSYVQLGATRARCAARELGWAMVAIGTTCVLLAGYLVWGTGFAERASQAALRRDFTADVTAARASALAGHLRGTRSRVTMEGGAIDRLQIPSIGLDAYVVEGVDEQDLARGPGHYPGTALPGQLGNAAIAGHRTTYGAPFYSLNALSIGDRILVTDREGHRFVYRVFHRPFAVPPSDGAVLQPARFAELTLTTCNPRYWATQRLVVEARLVSPVERPPAAHTRPFTLLAAATSSDPRTPSTPVMVWMLVLVALWAGLRIGSRVTRRGLRVAVVVGGTGACLIVLWFALGATAALLPQGI